MIPVTIPLTKVVATAVSSGTVPTNPKAARE